MTTGPNDAVTREALFDQWWREQTRRGDPMRRPHLTRDAFFAGIEASRAESRVAQEDAARMDWLDKQGRVTLRFQNDRPFAEYEVSTIREAIDLGRELAARTRTADHG